jgi:hypothetical protein
VEALDQKSIASVACSLSVFSLDIPMAGTRVKRCRCYPYHAELTKTCFEFARHAGDTATRCDVLLKNLAGTISL